MFFITNILLIKVKCNSTIIKCEKDNTIPEMKDKCDAQDA